MHHKILKHLLTLFFVLILLSILGMQWIVMENESKLSEETQRNAQQQQNQRFQLQKEPIRQSMEIRIY